VTDPRIPDVLAAVDLGSNSFHMVVARVVGNAPAIIDRLREQVQLGAGLDEQDEISPAARKRALDCLERFGERLRDLTGPGVRAVGTNTIRRARNSRFFLEEAEIALGHPIEVIAGKEEARLIYLGVCHTQDTRNSEKRLVIDIGGGSTELILGIGFEPELMRSTEMGCVAFSRRFFPDGSIKKKRLEEARLAARIELRGIVKRFRERGWESVVGASGTIRSVQRILQENGWSDRAITLEGIERLEEELVSAKAKSIAGLKAERAPVLPGGLMILKALFQGLKLESMDAAEGALREGVLFDLLGRMRHEDVRDRTIRALEDRYEVDRNQAMRVEMTARSFLAAVVAPWKLEPELAGRFLAWAARLHEIGLAVSYAGHNRHGAYLVGNSDMPGFSQEDRRLLAVLIGAQRSRVDLDEFQLGMPPRLARLAAPLAALLRLSIRLHRGRSWDDIPEIEIKAKKESLRLGFPAGWLDEHPLTLGDLTKEAKRIEALGLDVTIRDRAR
jgi:exopolyphosphatase/guanosine-5'-triphosphate,3'-diphosphate pyrophosphatase